MTTEKNDSKPVLIVFGESWMHNRYGIDFDEGYWQDPFTRTEMKMETERCLHKDFADVGIGSASPAPAPIASDEYGHRFMPALFGCNVEYMKDQSPGAIAQHLDFDALARLQIPDYTHNEVFKKAMSEGLALKKKYGRVDGAINFGSPLNTAVASFGTNFLECIALEPEIAQHVLKVIAQTEFDLYRNFCHVLEPESYPLDVINLGYGNCPAVMVSPEMYAEVVLPVDLWFRSQVGRFGMHHCGVIDAYLELYKALRPTSLDCGGGCDYKLIRKNYPDLRISYIVNQEYIQGKTEAEIDAHIKRIYTEGGPREKISLVWCAEIAKEVSVDTVKSLATSAIRQGL